MTKVTVSIKNIKDRNKKKNETKKAVAFTNEDDDDEIIDPYFIDSEPNIDVLDDSL
jgi:hypothetical protein